MRIEKAGTASNMQPMTAKQMHNRRESKNISSVSRPERTHENIYLGEKNIKKFIEKKLDEVNKNLKAQGKRRIRKDANLLFEMVVSADGDFFKRNDANQYFNDAREFVEKYFGKDSVVSDCRHFDEKTEHQHMLIMPLWEGAFNYNHYFHGRDSLSEFQGAMYNFMTNEKGYGFENRVLASESRKKHQSSLEWSKRVQKNSSMIDALDPKKQKDLALKGVIAEEEINVLHKSIEGLNKRIEDLEDEVIDTKRKLYDTERKYKSLAYGAFNIFKGDKVHKSRQVQVLESQGRKFLETIEQKEREEQEQKVIAPKEKTIGNDELER